MADSDLLVLDEPTNHLDIDAIAWLEERLAAYRGGLVLVTHDRHVLDRVTTEVLELDRGRGYLHDGGYDEYLEGRAAREEKAATDESTRRILARKELAWLRRGAPARTRKPKARIDAATAVVEGRAEPAARSGHPRPPPGDTPAGRQGRRAPRRGLRPPEGHAPLFERVDLLLDPRERLGIVGPNGVGKSTLLDLVAGRRPPTTGRVVHGPTVRLGYYDQVGVEPRPVAARPRRSGRRPPHSPTGETLRCSSRSGSTPTPSGRRSACSRVGSDDASSCCWCSPRKPNVLLLDEPTNDLDLDTLRVLEEFLDDWPGALVVVSATTGPSSSAR